MSSLWMIGLLRSPALATAAMSVVPLGILMGLCAAIAWGLSDFLMRGVSRAGGSPLRSLCGISLAAALGLSCVLPFGDALERLAQSPAPVLGLAALLGLLLVLANWFLYRAFARGSVSLVAPIANSHAAVTLLISLFAGARFAFPTVGAIGLICGGVALSSLPSPSPPTPQQRRRDEANLLACQSPWPSTDVSITWTPLALIPACSVPSLWNSLDAVYGGASVNLRSTASSAWVLAGICTRSRDEARLPVITQRSVMVPSALIWPSACSIQEVRSSFWWIVAMRKESRFLSPGVADALMSAFLLGAAFWAMQFVAPVEGATAAAWMVRTASAATLGIWIGARRLKSLLSPQPILPRDARDRALSSSRPRIGLTWRQPCLTNAKRTWFHLMPMAGVGMLDALATVSFGVGVTMSSAAMVATPASLSPVVTVALGCIILRERLAGHQLGGVMLALGGVLVLSAIAG